MPLQIAEVTGKTMPFTIVSTCTLAQFSRVFWCARWTQLNSFAYLWSGGAYSAGYWTSYFFRAWITWILYRETDREVEIEMWSNAGMRRYHPTYLDGTILFGKPWSTNRENTVSKGIRDSDRHFALGLRCGIATDLVMVLMEERNRGCILCKFKDWGLVEYLDNTT